MVSTSVLNALMEISVLSFIFPLAILLAWRMRTHKTLLPALAGLLIFLLFAKILESVPYALFLGFDSPVSKILFSNPILYALYIGIAAAVFEEIGRYLAFHFFLNKYEERQTAITYGIGHAGMECILVLGWTNLQYYVIATLANNNKLEDMTESAQSYLEGLTFFDCIVDGLTEVVLFCLQLSLSVLIFQASRNEKLRKRLLGIAMLMHAVFYLPNGFYEAGLIPHIVSLLLEILVMGMVFVLARDIYIKMGEKEKERQKAQKKKAAESESAIWKVAAQKLSNLEEKEKK